MRKFAFMFILSGIFFSCDSDDDHIDDGFQGETEEYEILAVGDSSIEGIVIFEEQEDGSTSVEIELEGTDEEETYPAAIHFGNAADGGDLAISLDDVDGETGASTTLVSEFDDESSASFEDLTELDGHIIIYLSDDESDQVIARGDIGENYFSGEEETYSLEAVGEEGSNGTIMFQERINGDVLVTLSLEEADAETLYPAHIHTGATGEEQGPSIFSLIAVDGETGVSFTNLSGLEVGEQELDFEDLLDFDGSVNVYLNEDSETLYAQGNIGANADE